MDYFFATKLLFACSLGLAQMPAFQDINPKQQNYTYHEHVTMTSFPSYPQ